MIIFYFGCFLSNFTGGRQMCYNCQYTITSTKQGIECASEYNDTINSGKCPFKCIIHSETNKGGYQLSFKKFLNIYYLKLNTYYYQTNLKQKMKLMFFKIYFK